MTISSVSNARPMIAAARPVATRPEAQVADSVTLGQSAPPCQTPQASPVVSEQPGQPQQPQLKEWTVLIYSVSDNNLYWFMQTDLNEAEKIGTTDEMNLVAETSHQPRKGSVVRLELKTNETPIVTSPTVQNLGRNYDMAQASSLADSIAWAMKEYPSKHFMLICSDHGAGWKGAHHSESKDSWMNLSDLESGLKMAQEKTGRKIDVLGFDECLMASTEVAHQLQPYANYMVGSEETEGGAGWQYDQALGKKTTNSVNRILTPKVLNYAATALRNRESLSPADMARGIVTMAEGHQQDLATMSALDLSKMPAVTAAFDNFAGKVLESGLTAEDFRPVFQEVQRFADFGDGLHLVELAGARFGGQIAEAAEGVKAAMSEALIAEQHSDKYPNAKGLNIEVERQHDRAPSIPRLEDEDRDRISFDSYANTTFARDTRWDEMLSKVR